MKRVLPIGVGVVAATAVVCLAAPTAVATTTAGTTARTTTSTALSAQYTCIYEVIGDGVRIRTGPGTNYPAFGQMHRGDYVLSDAVSNGWAHVRSDRHGSRWGWISLAYLSLDPGSCH